MKSITRKIKSVKVNAVLVGFIDGVVTEIPLGEKIFAQGTTSNQIKKGYTEEIQNKSDKEVQGLTFAIKSQVEDEKMYTMPIEKFIANAEVTTSTVEE